VLGTRSPTEYVTVIPNVRTKLARDEREAENYGRFRLQRAVDKTTGWKPILHCFPECRAMSYWPPETRLTPLALLDRNKCLAHRIAGVLAERTIEPVVGELFEDVRSPTGRSRDGKDAGE
jgi:hypothetical protein